MTKILNPVIAVPHLLNDLPTGRRVAVVLLICTVCGLGLGLLRPAWQVAVEPAQVIAGLVRYPPDNPFYIYEVKTWTLWHQLGALGLALGVSETTLSILLSALAGAVSLSALALWILALSDDALFAILASFFVVYASPYTWGINYPIMLMGEIHTYGMLGLSFIFLVVGLFGVGQHKAGALLLGLAPAIHPSLGLWCTLVVLLCVIWDYGVLRRHLREVAPYAALGYVVTAASFGFQQIMSSRLPAIAPAAADEYLSVFLRYWDVHRVPLDLFSLNVVLVWLGLCFSLMGIRFFKRDLPGGSLFLLRSLVASAVLGLGLSVLQQLSLQLPTALAILMPSRLLNFNVLAYLPVLLGLLWRYRGRISAQLNLLLLVVIFALSPLPSIFGIVILLVSGLAFVASAAFSRSRPPTLLSVSSSHPSSLIPHPSSFITFPVSRTTHYAIRNTLYLSTLFALAIILVLTGVRSYAVWSSRQDLFRDYTNDPLFAEISRGQGLLLTGTGPSMHLFQLYTRRPVLLDVEALDMLPYALEGGPQFDRILREVYGIAFDNPPQEARHRGVLPVEPIRTIWQQRTPEQWAAIAAGFGVSDIVTSADWELQLPEVARNDRFILYRIP